MQQLMTEVLQAWRFGQLLTPCTVRSTRVEVSKVWRFVQLLTIVQIRGDLRLVLHVWRFEQLLTTNKEMGTAEVFRKYGVSSTYLP